MTITVVFDPPLPSDAPATFNTKAFSTLGDLNTWSTQANALAVEVAADEASAAASAGTAGTAATTATTKAGEASTSATNAASSASAASTSASNAAASFDAFDDRYLGAKASDPALDNDGNALLTGALYWNSSSNVMRVYSGSAWGNVAPVATSVTAAQISDSTAVGRAVLTAVDAAAARTAIGVGAASGDVTGPASTTDNTIARFDGSTGKVLQSSASTLDDSGNLSTPGNVLSLGGLIGYGTGAGGTVTQATSKSTAVTLNKPSGKVTTNASALAAGASVYFLFSNSFIGADDTLSLSVFGGGAAQDRYALSAGVFSGGAYVSIRNTTGGSLSEPIDINFAVIKGATA